MMGLHLFWLTCCWSGLTLAWLVALKSDRYIPLTPCLVAGFCVFVGWLIALVLPIALSARELPFVFKLLRCRNCSLGLLPLSAYI